VSSKITKTEWMSLDETLDREVLFLLQGPEHAGEKFKAVMQNLVSGLAYVSMVVVCCQPFNYNLFKRYLSAHVHSFYKK